MRTRFFRPFDLTGRVVVITGGNGSFDLARGVAAAGADIAIVGCNSTQAKIASSSIAEEFGNSLLVVNANLTVEDDVNNAMAVIHSHFRRVDTVINNAEMSIQTNKTRHTLNGFLDLIDDQISTIFYMAHAVHRIMKRQSSGKIINIVNANAVLGAPFAAAYDAARGGIVHLTKTQSLAWTGDNIQVNAILPGWFDRDHKGRARLYVPSTHQGDTSLIPNHRREYLADITGTAVWLASSAGDSVTGIAIPIDGGYRVRV